MGRRMGSIVATLVAGLMFLGLAQQAALADGLSEAAESDILIGQGDEPLLPECFDIQGEHANGDPVVYGTFMKGQDEFELHADIYNQPTNGSWPIAVLAHGGGWVGGCCSEMDSVAVKLLAHGYIVMNIDYRLACTDTEIFLCGFEFSVPPNDAKTAIEWARDNISYNGRLVAIGTSGGGNIFYDANNQMTEANRPDVVAGISGPTELGYMSDGNKACDKSYPDVGNDCWPHTELFEGGSFVENEQHTPCSDNWQDGLPRCHIPSADVNPTFIANASKEATPWLEADDFRGALADSLVTVELCTVSNSAWKHYHGTQLLLSGVKCDGRTDSVFDYMLSWIASH